MAGERIGHLLSSLSEYQDTPFDFPDLDELGTYSDIFPTPLDMLAIPAKASMYMNIARMGMYGGKSLGLLSSMRKPFTSKRLKWHYEATHVKGLVGQGVMGPKPSSIFSIRGIQARMRIREGGDIDYIREPLKKKALREKFVYKSKDIRNIKETLKEGREAIKPGLLEKWLIRPNKLESLITSIDPSAIGKLGGMESITDKFIRGMYSVEEMDRLPRRIARKTISTGRGVLNRISSSVSSRSANRLKELSALDTGGVKSRDMLDKFVKYQKERFITPLDIIKGEYAGGSSFWRRRWDVAKEMVSFKEGTRKFAPWTSRSRTGARLVGGGEEVLNNVLRKAVTDKDLATPLAQRKTADHLIGMWRRHQVARFTKVAGAAFIGASIATELAKGMYQTVTEGMARGAATMGRMGRTEFGGGEVIQNSRLVTERQRAVEAISSAQMNARTLMGNEAAMYHA